MYSTQSGSVFTYCKVDACNSIHDDKDVGICEFIEAVVQPNRKHKHHQLQVKVEWWPRCWLMFRHRGNDGNVVLGVRWIQQGVKSASPRRDFTSESEYATNSWDANCRNHHNSLKQQLEVFSGHACSDIVHKGMDLAQTKHSKGLYVKNDNVSNHWQSRWLMYNLCITNTNNNTHSHVFTGLYWLESNKWDLHWQDGSQTINLKNKERTIHSPLHHQNDLQIIPIHILKLLLLTQGEHEDQRWWNQ